MLPSPPYIVNSRRDRYSDRKEVVKKVRKEVIWTVGKVGKYQRMKKKKKGREKDKERK
jgi:hypothetical protein